MHHNTYRACEELVALYMERTLKLIAALRRHGSSFRDLNVELLAPFTKSIAGAWCETFQTNMFTRLATAVLVTIKKLLKEVEESSAPGLKDYAAIQANHCIEMTQVAMEGTIDVVQQSITLEQRKISRSMAPNVQERLRAGYDSALQEKGKGSVLRQRVFDFNF
jgi:hypothetical protein